jgi:PAS domain S-box-containing protein
MTHERIIIDPTIANGLPIIRGTQTPVATILNRLAAGVAPEELVNQLPGLELADVKAALGYAATLAAQQPKPGSAGQPVENGPPVDQELDLKKILVVDDVEENRIVMRHLFRGSGFTLLMAADAAEALAKARAELPVLIISDIHMPNMTGFELLAALKADQRTKSIAVILISAHYRTSQQVSQGLIMGADDYIQRPFMRDEFMSRVEAVMRVKWVEAETRRQARVVAQRNEELELVNELALAVTLSLDPQEIFTSAMQKLSELLNVDAVSLLLLNQDRRELVINISAQTGKPVSIPFDAKSLANTDYEDAQARLPALVMEYLNDCHLALGIRPISDPGMVHTVPMFSKEQVVGAIAVVNQDGVTLDNTGRTLLNSAAGIIAVAVENARLLESAQRQVDDLIALNEIGRALTSTLDLEQTLKQTTLFVQRALQSQAASLWLLDTATQELVLTTASGIGSDMVTGFRLPIGQGIVGHVARTGDSYISADLSKDEHHFTNVPMDNYSPGSILSTPIQFKGQIIGVIQALHRNKNWFDHEHLRLSYPVANFVGIAIENARLFREVQDFNRRLERMVAERTRELAEEKEKTEAILASMADGLLVLDAGGCILTANSVAEHMLSFRLKNMFGKPIGPQELAHPLWRCISDIAGGADQTVRAAVDIPAARTGAVLSIQAHAAKVRSEAGQMIGTVIVLRDITALKEVERIKARFMAGVTHELKTPLSVIRLHSKNLLNYSDRLTVQKKNELLHSIERQAALLSQLIEDILELSRLDAGITGAERQPLDLVELLDRVVADLHPLAEEKQVTLRWSKPSTSLMALVDPIHMGRVARNLIDNALKYTPAGGSVTVQAFSEQVDGRSLVTLRVSDTGIGIAPRHQARIFERFYRVDPSHTLPGTGLGLAIVKEIVNAHGGSIQLESSPGAGSTFMVRLPKIAGAQLSGG